jgi:lipid-A-disaccharide synthase
MRVGKMKPRFMILAGEVSGDLHAAALVRAIKRQAPDSSFTGMGGPAMREAGVRTRCDIADLAVMGFIEVIPKLFFFRRLLRQLLDEAGRERPDAVILVDYPGFNLRFAAAAHRAGLKTVYYICPKVWAWQRSRIPKMVSSLDRLACIFPFEPALFADTGLKADFVGNPLVDMTEAERLRPAPPLDWGGEPRVALLPGSREQEIRRLMPVLAAAARQIEIVHPGAGFIVPAPDENIAAMVRANLDGVPERPARCAVVVGQTHAAMHQARAAIIASGTATLEACLFRCPTVLTYKASVTAAWFVRRVIRIPYIGLVNILAGRFVCPELLQEDATPEKLAEVVLPLLGDTPQRAAMLEGMDSVNNLLGQPGAADRAATAVLETCAPRQTFTQPRSLAKHGKPHEWVNWSRGDLAPENRPEVGPAP